jgi:hypothetical protein
LLVKGGSVDSKGLRTKLSGLVTCGAAILALICLRFAASVLHGMLGIAVGESADLPRLAVIALSVTGRWVVIPAVLVCVAAVGASEAILERETHRLLVQGAVLLFLVILMAVCLAGFFISFYIPDVRID